MPKRLILFRHAKSSWTENAEDHERPLAERGRKAAPRMGEWLARENLVPDMALVSTARRARETWALAAPELETPVEKQDTNAIYEASATAILDAIRQMPDQASTLIVVGHNPGFEDLAALLMADGGGEPGVRLREKFPTAAVAVLECPVEHWSGLQPGTCRLDRFVTPKSL
jgi:phosphohistidine phosphatase